MKLLLDENLPGRFKNDFSEHETSTVSEEGWNGISNGKPLQLMLENDFDALITFDKNLQHQQNFDKFPVRVIVLTAQSNQYRHLHPLAEKIREQLRDMPIGVVTVGDLF